MVDGDFIVAEIDAHNRGFKVFRRNQLSLFVKQVKLIDETNVQCLRREAAVYRLAQASADFAPLADAMLGFVDYDGARHIIIVELAPDGENLLECHLRLEAYPPEIGQILGKQLAACHGVSAPTGEKKADMSFLPGRPPWILSFHLSEEGGFSGANAQLLDFVREGSDFPQFLNELRDAWQTTHLIHGDIKWTNCIVFPGEDGKPGIRFVDWEMADLGDPAWDVGTVLQSYWSHWLLSEHIQSEVAPEQLLQQTGPAFEPMQAAMREFWNAYSVMILPEGDSRLEHLGRCVRFAAARMVQTAYESMTSSSQLSPEVARMLQLSQYVLKNPDRAISQLLGL